MKLNITPKYRVLPDDSVWNVKAIETDEWEEFVKSDIFGEISLLYAKFAEKIDKDIIREIVDTIKFDQNISENIPMDFPGMMEIISDIFDDEFIWRDDVEVDLKERALRRFKKDYTSFHICANNGSILGLSYMMKNLYSRIKWKWFTIGDPDEISSANKEKKERYIIGPKQGQLSVGNLRSVSNQIKLRAKKLHLIYCGIVSEPTEAIIFMLYAIIIAKEKCSIICRLSERFSSSLLAAIYLFANCFETVYLKYTFTGTYIIGRTFIDSIIDKKIIENIYSYLDNIIKDSDVIFPIYKHFNFIPIKDFINILKGKLRVEKKEPCVDLLFESIKYIKIPKNLSKCYKQLTSR